MVKPTPLVDVIGPVMQEYVARAYTALSSKPNRVVSVNPGSTTPDDDSCSQLSMKVVNIRPFTGRQGATNVACGVLEWHVTMALGLKRCIATINDSAEPPSAAQMNQDGLQILQDLQELDQVVRCHPRTISIQGWAPYANQSGLGGGEWTFLVRIPACVCHLPEPATRLPS